MSLAITTTTTPDGAIVVAASGEVDVSCASELRDAVDAALDAEASRVDVDLADVPYIDSTGIGVLVGAAHRAIDLGIGFGVRNPQRNVKRVLDLLGITLELGADATQG